MYTGSVMTVRIYVIGNKCIQAQFLRFLYNARIGGYLQNNEKLAECIRKLELVLSFSNSKSL